MSETTAPALTPSAYAAAELRAAAARRNLGTRELADMVTRDGRGKVSPMWVHRRLQAHVATSLDDLDRLCRVLEVDLGDLLPRP